MSIYVIEIATLSSAWQPFGRLRVPEHVADFIASVLTEKGPALYRVRLENGHPESNSGNGAE